MLLIREFGRREINGVVEGGSGVMSREGVRNELWGMGKRSVAGGVVGIHSYFCIEEKSRLND